MVDRPEGLLHWMSGFVDIKALDDILTDDSEVIEKNRIHASQLNNEKFISKRNQAVL